MSKHRTIFGYVLVPEQEWQNYGECIRQRDSYKAACVKFGEERDALIDAIVSISSASNGVLNRLGINVPSQK